MTAYIYIPKMSACEPVAVAERIIFLGRFRQRLNDIQHIVDLLIGQRLDKSHNLRSFAKAYIKSLLVRDTHSITQVRLKIYFLEKEICYIDRKRTPISAIMTEWATSHRQEFLTTAAQTKAARFSCAL